MKKLYENWRRYLDGESETMLQEVALSPQAYKKLKAKGKLPPGATIKEPDTLSGGTTTAQGVKAPQAPTPVDPNDPLAGGTTTAQPQDDLAGGATTVQPQAQAAPGGGAEQTLKVVAQQLQLMLTKIKEVL